MSGKSNAGRRSSIQKMQKKKKPKFIHLNFNPIEFIHGKDPRNSGGTYRIYMQKSLFKLSRNSQSYILCTIIYKFVGNYMFISLLI